MPKQLNVERRYLTQEFRVSKEGEAAKIEGYASLFNSRSEDLGGWREEIDPAAFDAVMASNPDVRALWNHNADVVLGRTAAGTLKLNIDARGLAYEVDPPDTQQARDLMVSMRRGDITQSSFGFICGRDQWTEEKDGTVTRRILEFDSLLDVSPVTYPAYTATSSGVRSLPDSMPTEIRSRFEARRLAHTKEVDGEALHAEDFIIVGDPERTDSWHLPWHFSDEEKTKSHLRDALARFDQLKGVSAQDKKSAWNKLVALCEEHGIEVSDEDKQKQDRSLRAFGFGCTCACAQCRSGACGICSNKDCLDPECACDRRSMVKKLMELQLAALS
jgi:HK97 family phage prohead protease